MLKIILIIATSFASVHSFSQSAFMFIDENSKTIPDTVSSYSTIAKYLTKYLSTDEEKIRAIYIWISHNIKYDLDLLTSEKVYNSSDDIIHEALANRKGICQHYSELFLAMSRLVGIKSYIISGYTQQYFGVIANYSHTWNAVKIDSTYYLLDLTWAAGYVQNNNYIHEFRDDYFMISPKKFIRSHMPFDPIWQFLSNPISNVEFVSGDFSKLEQQGEKFQDSIVLLENVDQLTQLHKSYERIIASGVKNNFVSHLIKENLSNIAILRYNLAIVALNQGISNYNVYIDTKNRKFRNPKLSDIRIKGLIDGASVAIYRADMEFNKLSTEKNGPKDPLHKTKEKMIGLISDLNREKEFVARYLKAWKPLRIFLF